MIQQHVGQLLGGVLLSFSESNHYCDPDLTFISEVVVELSCYYCELLEVL